MYNIVLNFRDRMVHRLELGDNLQLARNVLDEINSCQDANKSFRFTNRDSDVLFVSNLHNFQFAFIEEVKEVVKDAVIESKGTSE